MTALALPGITLSYIAVHACRPDSDQSNFAKVDAAVKSPTHRRQYVRSSAYMIQRRGILLVVCSYSKVS